MDLSRRKWLRLSALGAVGAAGCTSGSRPTIVGTPAAGASGPADTPGSTSGGSSSTDSPAPTAHPLPSPTDRCSADAAIEDDDPLTVAFDARERRKCTGEPLDNFERLEHWDAYAGSLAADGERAYTGSQSARIEAAPSDDRAWIYRRFPGGVDLSAYDLSLAVRLDEPAFDGIVVRLDAPDPDNAVLAGRYVWRAGWLRVDLGPRRVVGSPDLTNVTEVSVQLYTGGGTRARLNLDSLRRRERTGPGRAVVTFDNNRRSQYTQAFEVMEQYGFPGVVGVVPGTTDRDLRISIEGLRELQSAGWDVASSPAGSGGLRSLGADRQVAAIRENKRWLVGNGFERGANVLVWPRGQYDRSSLAAASRYHYLGFAGGGTPVGMVSAPLTLGRVEGESVAAAKQAVDFAAEYDMVLALSYGAVGNMMFGMSRREFEETMAYVDGADVEVVTATELWQSLR